MELQELFQFISIILAMGGFFASVFQLIKQQQNKKKGIVSLQQRIENLTAALRESVKLIDSITREIESKQQLAVKLQKDNEIVENLLKLKRPEVEAIAQTLRTELDAQDKKSFLRGVAVNAGFFIAGAIVSVITTLVLSD
jgi:Fe2+ transport system protein B